MSDEKDQDLDLDLEGGDEGGDTGDESETPPEADAGEVGGDKRIRDLQSKADKAEARANKAEAALAKSLKPGEGDAKGSNDPEREALLLELRDASLDTVYGEFAELKEYGIDQALIEGQTRAEMRESASTLVALIKGVETKARNRALRDAGVKAEPVGATRQAPKNYAAMSDEDIEKEISRARSGGDPLW